MLVVELSWQLLLSVKRMFTDRVTARVGDVLREICSEWTRYQTREALPDEFSEILMNVIDDEQDNDFVEIATNIARRDLFEHVWEEEDDDDNY
jgi:fructose-1,6-bisphosphatase